MKYKHLESHISPSLQFIVAFFCIQFLSVPTFATTTDNSSFQHKTLNLNDCFQKAYENNKELSVARGNLPIEQATIQIAGAIPNPQFTLLYGFGPSFNVILAGNPQQFGWQQQFLTAGQRTKRLNLARANYQLTQLQVASTLFDIRNRVRRAYTELAAAETYNDLIKEQKQAALELVNNAEKRYQTGKVSKAESLQARLGVLQLDILLNQAQLRLERASTAMSLLIGETPEHVETIAVDENGVFKLSANQINFGPAIDLPLPPIEQLLSAGYKLQPNIKVATQQIFTDRRALTLAKAERIPNFFIDTGYQFTTFTPRQPYNLTPIKVPNVPGCYLNVVTELPIFYQQQGEIIQSKQLLLQDYDELKLSERQSAKDILTAYESIVLARANIAIFQKRLLPTAAQLANLLCTRYKTGKTSLTSALQAMQQYQQTLSSYLDAVIGYQNAWADLEKAMGVPLRS